MIRLTVPEVAASPQLLGFLEQDTAWPLVLVGPDQHILAASAALARMIECTPQQLANTPVEMLFPDEERARVTDWLREVTTGGEPAFLRTRLLVTSPLPIEIEAVPVSADGLMTLLFHRSSRTHNRDRILLELNRLTPALLAATSVEQVFTSACEALKPLGLSLALALLEADESALRISYTALSSYTLQNIRRDDTSEPIRLPRGLPGYEEVLSAHKTVFMPDDWSYLHVCLPPAVADLAEAALHLRGQRGYILAPLLFAQQARGVLIIWGPVLSRPDMPFVEAFANQVSACVAQVEARRAMELQIQRLNSLATTAQAVTRLGTLDEALQVICLQAQELLGAQMAAVALPAPDAPAATFVMSTGADSEALRGARVPLRGSITGEVLLSGQGRYIADAPDEAGAYRPLLRLPALRCLLLQPLVHRGAVLGALVVSHSTPGFFTRDDLEYLARYAEYATVAVANAQLHAALQQSEQRARMLFTEAEEARVYLRALIDHTRDVLLTIRPDMTFQALNPARLSTLTGYQPEEFVRSSLLAFVPARQHADLLERWRAVLAGEPRSMELELRHANGAPLCTLVSAVRVPHYDEVFVIIKDITERKQLEAHARHMEKLAVVGQLVAGIAHELNNPLAVILGLAQLQLFESLPESAKTDLSAIEQAALRASQVVEQLRIFAQPLHPYVQPINLDTAIREGLERLEALISEYQVQVRIDLEPNLPRPLGAPEQLQRAIQHVLSNALHALALNPAGKPRQIMIRAWTEASYVRITISDTGPGVSEEDQQHLFAPFFTTRAPGEGLGLGLAIVHTIVQQHGGQVWIESAPNQPTTVHISLPVNDAHTLRLRQPDLSGVVSSQ